MRKTSTLTWAGLALVALAAAILTFTTLRDLAIACGITGSFIVPLSWLVPVTIDAAGLVALRIWLTSQQGTREAILARKITWTCIGLSIAGNAAQHAMAAYGATPAWWLIVLVSAVPPAMLGAVTHLAVLLARVPEPEALPEPVHQPEPDTVPIPIQTPPVLAAVAPEPTPDTPSPDDSSDPLVDQLRAWVADLGEMPSKRKVIAEMGVGHRRATELMAAAAGVA